MAAGGDEDREAAAREHHERAAAAFGLLLSLPPVSEPRPVSRLAYAESLFGVGRYREAAQQYAAVHATQEGSEHHLEAARGEVGALASELEALAGRRRRLSSGPGRRREETEDARSAEILARLVAATNAYLALDADRPEEWRDRELAAMRTAQLVERPGSAKEARQWFRQVLALDPEDGVAQQAAIALVRSYEQAGDSEGAVAATTELALQGVYVWGDTSVRPVSESGLLPEAPLSDEGGRCASAANPWEESAFVIHLGLSRHIEPGWVDHDEVVGTQERHAADAAACFEGQTPPEEPREDPLVELLVMIGPEGRALRTVVRRDTTGSGAVATCLREQVARWEFPRPEGGQVTVALEFSPDE